MVKLIYGLTLSFQEVYLFKPCATHPCSAEKYLVCKQLLQHDFPNVVPPKEFCLYLKQLNQKFIQQQINSLQTIYDVYQGQTLVPPLYDIRKPLIVWSLPSCPNAMPN
jgi:hypothetical protein